VHSEIAEGDFCQSLVLIEDTDHLLFAHHVPQSTKNTFHHVDHIFLLFS